MEHDYAEYKPGKIPFGSKSKAKLQHVHIPFELKVRNLKYEMKPIILLE